MRAALAIRDALADGRRARGPDRHHDRRGARRARRAPEAGEGMVVGRRGQHRRPHCRRPRPPDGILVDETTFAGDRARDRVRGGRARSTAKGKSEPVPVWEAARGPRPRRRRATSSDAPLVGREHELTLLRETGRVAQEREPQLVTLVGVPGIGKSRLVFELFETIEPEPRARLLATGALAAVRRGRHVLGARRDRQGPGRHPRVRRLDATAEKLRQAVESVLADPAEAGWVERHLRPLVGLELTTSGRGRRERSVRGLAALPRGDRARTSARARLRGSALGRRRDARLRRLPRRLGERRAAARPLPARPELLDPASRLGRRQGQLVDDPPLAAIRGRDVVARDVLCSAMRRSRPTCRTRSSSARAGIRCTRRSSPACSSSVPRETVVPETVQGIIAARLDTLPRRGEGAAPGGRGRRQCLLARCSRARALDDRGAAALPRAQGVRRRELRSSVAGEDEYIFRHALVRDVAYEQIPRSERAEKHRAAAEWIESLGGPTTTPRCSSTTTRLLSSSPGYRVRT